jgi:predicted transcriptional regulator
MSEPDETPAVKTAKADWVKLMMGGGFAVVVGIWLVKYMMAEGSTNGEFQRTTIKESTAAMVKAADAMDDLATAVNTSVDEQRELRTDLAPLVKQLDRVADSLTDSIEQQAAAEKAKLERIAAKELQRADAEAEAK